jgi:pyruvate/2-oxoglutarate dehydrogenase complex dihydrolipoamide acyltransferase (E2) component
VPVQIVLPQIGFSMSEGTLNEWLAKDGEMIKEGQPLYTLESDKSVNEVESPASGILKIIAEPGKLYQVGDLLAQIMPPSEAGE